LHASNLEGHDGQGNNRKSQEMRRQHQVPRPERPVGERVGIDEWKVIDFSSQQSSRLPCAIAGSVSSSREVSSVIASGNDITALVAALMDHTRAIDTLVATLAPETPDYVGTEYLARKLGMSPQWIAKMAERGDIPRHIIAPKVSGGRIWRFDRAKLDAWLRNREEA
jgi:hypothetical protein